MHREPFIPGVRRFIGAGVYLSMPEALPPGLRGRDAIVAGTIPASAAAVLRLADWCRAVTLIKASGARVRALPRRENITVLRGAEVVCVEGIAELECVVVRQIRTGAVTVHVAAALFLMQDERRTALEKTS